MCVRLRSGSPSGAMRSSTWKTSVRAQSISCSPSSSNIRSGELPPLSASENAPALGDRGPGRIADQLRRAARGRLGVAELLVRQSFFSSWPPNCLRIADSTLSAKSSSPRESKRE